MENRYKKSGAVLFIFAFAIGLFFPLSVLGEDLSPKYNPICWEQKACEEARADFVGESNAKASEGWLENQYPCDAKGWGMCLPANATVAQVSFGGSKEFKNVGDYIKTVYNYSLLMIGILAVVMIIIAGAQWASSGGNGEVIKQSQKRITGAIIGLFIAFMSYNILQSINPATVNLRLPQVYMIRQQILPSKWCRELDPKTDFAFGASHEKQKDEIKATNDSAYNLKYPHDNPADKNFWCGQRFFIGGASTEAFCWGDRCGKDGGLCTNVDPVDPNNPYMCRKASIAGEVKNLNGGVDLSSVIGDEWEDIDDDIELYLVCAKEIEGRPLSVSLEVEASAVVTDEVNKKQGYILRVEDDDLDNTIKECGDASKVIGGYMVMNFTPNMSTNMVGEDKAIGKDGKEIWGAGGLFFLIKTYPFIIKNEAFIPLSSIRSGIMLKETDASKVKMYVTFSTALKLSFDIIFGDSTIAGVNKDMFKMLASDYSDSLSDIGKALLQKLSE